MPKSTKDDLKKRSASNVNCNDLNNVIPSQQAILNHPELSVCDITYTYSQETEAITHDDMGTLEISRRVLEQSGMDPEDVDFFEAHGTGTAIGDVVEIDSIADTYSRRTATSKRKLRIGSVKSNLNHTESTSGLAGLWQSWLARSAECSGIRFRRVLFGTGVRLGHLLSAAA